MKAKLLLLVTLLSLATACNHCGKMVQKANEEGGFHADANGEGHAKMMNLAEARTLQTSGAE
jgi:ketopantoate hydroxymethyltransferase